MFCPNCGAPIPEEMQCCPNCGCSLQPAETDCPPESIPLQQAVPAEPAALPVFPSEPSPVPPAPVKGRKWPPLLALALMALVGFVVFFVTGGMKSSVPAEPFTVRDGKLSFHAAYYSGTVQPQIPAVIDGETVTALEDRCFSGWTELETALLPETITRIGSGAFSGCTALRGIRIPESVRQIDSGAFENCTALEAICIPYTTREIGSDAFRGCNNLKYIFYPGPASAWAALRLPRFQHPVLVICSDTTLKWSTT